MTRKHRALLFCSLLFNFAFIALALYIGYLKFYYPYLDKQDALHGPRGVELKWRDARDLRLEGKGWTDTEHLYDRLPARAKGQVPERIWALGQNPAGLQMRFVTDATTIHVRWTLRSRGLTSPHMASTGYSGLDLYVRHNGAWRWAAVARPYQFPANRARLTHDMPPGKREYLLYLPIFNGIESMQIGVPPGATLTSPPASPAGLKPVVFYGTSITQGGVVSRPGMAYPAILGRRLQRPVLNLGFSGYGEMQPEVVKLLAELDPAVFVINCLPNMDLQQVQTRARPLVETLRRAHPSTPVLLVEQSAFASYIKPATSKNIAAKNAALRQIYFELQKQGVLNLYFLRGDNMMGSDDDATVDGIHPTDLGFHRIANSMEPVLRQILKTAP